MRIALVIAGLSLAIGGCGSVKLPSLTTGSVTAPAQPAAPPDDPVARGVEVGVTSARAQKCGYFFDPQQLRVNFLAAEAQRTTSPDVLRKIETAHDFARLRVARQIANDEDYCSGVKTGEIKKNLTRYLAGDFSATKKKKQIVSNDSFDIFGKEIKEKPFNPASIHDPILNDDPSTIEP